MITKQECFSEKWNPQSSAIDLNDMHLRDAVFYGMDLYRKDGAIEFLKWAVDKYSISFEGFVISCRRGEEPYVWDENGNEITLSQLFELFLQSLFLQLINQK